MNNAEPLVTQLVDTTTTQHPSKEDRKAELERKREERRQVSIRDERYLENDISNTNHHVFFVKLENGRFKRKEKRRSWCKKD